MRRHPPYQGGEPEYSFFLLGPFCRLLRPSTLLGRRKWLRVDEYHGDDARLVAAHAPGVVGAALDEDVAGLEQRLPLVDDGVDLALQHHDVVDGAGLVHHRIAGAAIGRVRRVECLGPVAGVRAALPLRIRGKLDDAKERAVLRRLEAHFAVAGVLPAGVVGRYARLPELGDREPGA